ncbi:MULTISPECIES: AIPR family protein [Klebsiella]|mgnify:CR=1 FL=1|uniref:AIPR family protein n=1 Tax=Klebsiella pneumoniae complex TaxID=3390273 RepID=UPI00083FD9E1|nr:MULTISPECIES: AIPR family protein [Klebsiella]EKZ9770451.1 AIPR family protein [Klebsiella variicola]MDL4074144.1 AIPR family protein [Klebsiella quasipneumoniae]MRE65691.1 abortive phage resistance protein [Klebsiella quasipneumoniae]QDL58151.1 AIPR family protein [Klebsiella pneumoniae]BBS84225.1 putative abortive infection phage resistance protein [Klebsiella quasipneumoniae]
MAALQPQFLAPLKELLQQRFVPHLPPLLGQDGQEDKPKKQISRAFSAFVLQQKFDLDVVTATKAVVDDYEDHGLDAIYYHEADQTLYLVQSKMKVDAQFTLGEAQAFIEGIKLLLNKQFNRFNQNVQNLQAQIETALDECEHIQLLIAYTGSGITMQAQNYLQPAIQELIDEGEEQIEPGYQEFTATDVEQALRSEHAVDTVNERVAVYKFRVQEQPRKVVFGIAKLTDLIALHTTHDRKLYEKNIRYFIGSGRRGVNKAIKDTLLHEPENFIYLNNGITLDGNAVKPKGNIRGHTGSKHIAVDGLSVVNGAQTIASAAQFMRENLDADISQAQVMVTIINTGNDAFHKQVTKARNLQNPVDLANFAALDDTQERLRQEMKMFGVEYLYRPQQSAAAGIRSITIETLAKALACMQADVRVPYQLKAEPSRFINQESVEYQAIFNPDLQGVMAINAVNIYLAIQALCTAAERSSPSPEKLVYRHFTYCITTLLMAQFKNTITAVEITEQEAFERLISRAFDELRQKFSDSFRTLVFGSAPHAYFKRLSDTARLMQTVWVSHLNLAENPAVIAKQRLQPNDPYNRNLFSYLAKQAQRRQEQNAQAANRQVQQA